jgi:hypothetical protein
MKGFDTEEWYEQYQAKRQAAKGAPVGSLAHQLLSNVGTLAEQKASAKQIIRQSRKGLNKTETRFLNEYLNPMVYEGAIDEIGDHESITLKLANGLRLRPDFPTWTGGRLTFYEVKGGRIWEDSIKSLKIAANKYKHCRFFIFKYVKGQWFKQEVLP